MRYYTAALIADPSWPKRTPIGAEPTINARQARTDFSRAIELEPKGAWPHFHRADSNLHAGELRAALADYSRATQLAAVASVEAAFETSTKNPLPRPCGSRQGTMDVYR